jgi:hypothetical protein
MPKSQKHQNNSKLTVIVICNVLLFGVLIFNLDFIEMITLSGTQNIEKTILIPLVSVLVVVGNALLSPIDKARLVFWRWKHPLPGSRAFSKHAKRDPRIDRKRLLKTYGKLPEHPSKQNTFWYRLYKEYEYQPSVIQAHKAYLFCRDYTSFSALFMLGFGVPGFVFASGKLYASIYLLLLCLQYLWVRRAAATNGNSLVTNVLAVASLKDDIYE